MKKGAFPAPAASLSRVPAASRRVPPPALLSAPATRSFFVQYIPAARAEINEEKIVRFARRLIGARARRRGAAAAGRGGGGGLPAAPGALRGDRGGGGGGVPRGCAHLTATCPRCPGGLSPPPRRASAGEGPARGSGGGAGGGGGSVLPQRGVASANLCGLGMSGRGGVKRPPRFLAEWRGGGTGGRKAGQRGHRRRLRERGAKRREREADLREMNDSGLPVVDLGQEVRRSVLHTTGFRFSKWQRELIVLPS